MSSLGLQNGPVQILEFTSGQDATQIMNFKNDIFSNVISTVDERQVVILSIVSIPHSKLVDPPLLMGCIVKYLQKLQHQNSLSDDSFSSIWNWMEWKKDGNKDEVFEQFSEDKPGIWMWPRVFNIKSVNQGDISVVLLHAHASCDEDVETEMVKRQTSTLIHLSCLLSSCLVINTTDLGEATLDLFPLALCYGQTVVDSMADQHHEIPFISKPYQKLVFLLREPNVCTHPLDLIQAQRDHQPHSMSLSNEENSRRRQLASCFETLRCKFLPCLSPSQTEITSTGNVRRGVPITFSSIDHHFAKNLDQLITNLLEPSQLPVQKWPYPFLHFQKVVDLFNKLSIEKSIPSKLMVDLLKNQIKTWNAAVVDKCQLNRQEMMRQLVKDRFFSYEHFTEIARNARSKTLSAFEQAEKMGDLLDANKALGNLSSVIQDDVEKLWQLNQDHRNEIFDKALTSIKQHLNQMVSKITHHFDQFDCYDMNKFSSYCNELKQQLISQFNQFIGNGIMTVSNEFDHRFLQLTNHIDSTLSELQEKNQKAHQDSQNKFQETVKECSLNYDKIIEGNVKDFYVYDGQLEKYHQNALKIISDKFSQKWPSTFHFFNYYQSDMLVRIETAHSNWKEKTSVENAKRVELVKDELDKLVTTHHDNLAGLQVPEMSKFREHQKKLSSTAHEKFKLHLKTCFICKSGPDEKSFEMSSKLQGEYANKLTQQLEAVFQKKWKPLEELLTSVTTDIEQKSEKTLQDYEKAIENLLKRKWEWNRNEICKKNDEIYSGQKKTLEEFISERKIKLTQAGCSQFPELDKMIQENYNNLQGRFSKHRVNLTTKNAEHHLNIAKEKFGSSLMMSLDGLKDENAFRPKAAKLDANTRSYFSENTNDLPKAVKEKLQLFLTAQTEEARIKFKKILRRKLAVELEAFGLSKFVQIHGPFFYEKTMNEIKLAVCLKIDQHEIQKIDARPDRYTRCRLVYDHIVCVYADECENLFKALAKSGNVKVLEYIRVELNKKKQNVFVQVWGHVKDGFGAFGFMEGNPRLVRQESLLDKMDESMTNLNMSRPCLTPTFTSKVGSNLHNCVVNRNLNEQDQYQDQTLDTDPEEGSRNMVYGNKDEDGSYKQELVHYMKRSPTECTSPGSLEMENDIKLQDALTESMSGSIDSGHTDTNESKSW